MIRNVIIGILLCVWASFPATGADPLAALSEALTLPDAEGLRTFNFAYVKQVWAPEFEQQYAAKCSYTPAPFDKDFNPNTTSDQDWRFTEGVQCRFGLTARGKTYTSTLKFYFSGPDSVGPPRDEPIDLTGPNILLQVHMMIQDVGQPEELDAIWAWGSEHTPNYTFNVNGRSCGDCRDMKAGGILSQGLIRDIQNLKDERSLFLRGRGADRDGREARLVQMVARHNGALWTLLALEKEE